MRKVTLGAAPVRGNWNPKFKIQRKKKPHDQELGQKKAPVVSWHPTIKGEQRVEGLRQYFHRDMALLLDAWPEVTGWTTDAPAIMISDRNDKRSFTPHFLVDTTEGSYALRLRQAATEMPAASHERYQAVRQAYAQRGMPLVIMTQEEFETHPGLPAARDLFYYRYWDWPDDLPFDVADLAEQRGLRTFGELHQALGGTDQDKARLLSLASHGYVLFGTAAGLRPDTPILACRTSGWRA